MYLDGLSSCRLTPEAGLERLNWWRLWERTVILVGEDRERRTGVHYGLKYTALDGQWHGRQHSRI